MVPITSVGYVNCAAWWEAWSEKIIYCEKTSESSDGFRG